MADPVPVPDQSPPANLLRDASLFLDFDGTLVEIAERPDAVRVDARLHALMRLLLERLDGRVAVISGRPAAQIRALFGDAALTIVGSHGLEYAWADGRPGTSSRPEALDEVLAEMKAFAARTPGILIEDKPLGAALHFRQAPDAEQASTQLATELAEKHGLYFQPGKMMAEVRAGGGDKGSALRALMREPGVAATRPLFMGDDLTDESGFAAAAELGGAGILVGPARPSAARFRLGDVEAVLDWLDAACGEAA